MTSALQSPDSHGRQEISVLKGLGILLVIFGHIPGSDGPWSWQILRRIVFDVHVPLFFVVSGFLRGVGQACLSRKSFRRDFLRLGVPLLVFSTLPLLGLGLLGLIPHPPFSLPEVGVAQVFAHLRNPQWGGFAVHLWFLYTLLMIRLSYPFLQRALRSDTHIFVVFLGLSLLPLPGDGCLRLTVLHLPLYCFGVLMAAGKLGHADRWFRSYKLILAILLFVTFSIFPRLGPSRCILGVCGTLLLWFIARVVVRSERGRLKRILTLFGDRSLEVYLIHPLFLLPTMTFMSRFPESTVFWVAQLGLFTLVASSSLALGLLVDKVPQLSALLFGRFPETDHSGGRR